MIIKCLGYLDLFHFFKDLLICAFAVKFVILILTLQRNHALQLKQKTNTNYAWNGKNNKFFYRTMKTIKQKFPLAPMGVLAPGSAHARPSARLPINTNGNFPAHVCAESPSNIGKHWKTLENIGKH